MKAQNLAALALSGALLLPAILLTPELTGNEAHAQDQRKAKRAYKAAKKAYLQKNYPDAARLFKEAYSHDPKPQLLFNIGQSLKESGELQEAEQYYTQYLEELPDAPNGEQVLETLFELQQLLAAQFASISVNSSVKGLDVFVNEETDPRCQTPCVVDVAPGTHTLSVDGKLYLRTTKNVSPTAQEQLNVTIEPKLSPDAIGTLWVNTDVRGAVLSLDGKPRGGLPLRKPIRLKPGKYPATIKVNGQTRWQGSVSMQAGQTSQLDVPLEGATSANDASGTSALAITGYTLMGVGAGSMLAGALFGLSASGIEEDLNTQMGRNEIPNPELIDRGKEQALYANVFYGLGAVSFSTGLLFWVLDGPNTEESTPNTETSLIPLEGGGMVQMQGSF